MIDHWTIDFRHHDVAEDDVEVNVVSENLKCLGAAASVVRFALPYTAEMVIRLAAIAIVLGLGCGTDDGDSLPGPDAAPGAVNFTVTVESSVGPFVIDVTREWAPNGADRFRELVEDGFYDDCRFFRVIPGFVVQFGINGDPTTQAVWNDASINDDPVVVSNVRGTVTFAQTSAPNSRTTQLFINYADNSNLDASGFAPFGVVRSGMENIDTINSQYGEAPDQGSIRDQGNAYLDTNFPNLDAITTAVVAP